LKYAFMQIQDYHLAQEIVQEAFARAWASPKTPPGEPEFRRWLYRSITNLARDYHRRRVRLAALPVPAPKVLDPLEQVERRAGDEALRGALQTLGIVERQVLYLRYFEDLSVAEVGRILGRPRVTIRVLAHRALEKLRRQLDSEQTTREVAV
jgi:RNA polymerase sigma-70 factor (ECF subfamily)